MNPIPFCDITNEWFSEAFGEPTQVQKEAWPSIAAGKDTLVSAPTGTGKTLSAFLVFIDRLSELARRGELNPEMYVIYISPLRSLAGDIRENLRKPLDGISLRENLRDKNTGGSMDGGSTDCGSTDYGRVDGGSLESGNSGSGRADGGSSDGGRSSRKDSRRLLDGVSRTDFLPGAAQITIGVRTGDTTASDRRAMFKNPPHILITTPESLYILLTSLSGIRMLRTAQTVIVDELHALIDTKRGAHLMLSLARLDALHGAPLQRIGLSATIEPLDTAARYLSANGADIVSPKSKKAIEITVKSSMPESGILPQGTIWPEIAREVYKICEGTRCVIAFVESRTHAERLAHQVNLLGGDGFALTHHGSVSKERRMRAEQELREGKLRLLCATSSMELGIDVGDIDRVVQIGCPRTVSSTLQRLGRAGHNPGRVSVMRIMPRTPAEGLMCGITSELARNGVIEPASPPRACLDVLAQHLVSMAAVGEYTIGDVLDTTARAYPFIGVTVEQVEKLLEMLAGDYEHDRDIPVRPRLLYDRINGRVRGDAYSRLLALSAGGTIPDRGLFAVRGENGVRYGEVDEEFVFEARVGDRFLLGAFAWRILSIGRDDVVVAQSGVEGVQPPFWKGEVGGRALHTGLSYGKLMREISDAAISIKEDTWMRGDAVARRADSPPDNLDKMLYKLGLDPVAADGAKNIILRQIDLTGALPDDRTIIVEHFQNEVAEHQLVVHSIFGKKINAPLALLARESARHILGSDVGVYDDDDGFLLFPVGGKILPDGLLYTIEPSSIRSVLDSMLPATPLFSMSFRYNAARALMMGVRKRGRQPLWIQRQKGAKLLDQYISVAEHPLIWETKRECVENYWDVPGLEYIINAIRSGEIAIREINTYKPSPLSLPFRRAVEMDLMYDYTPTSPNVAALTRDAVAAAIAEGKAISPGRAELEAAGARERKFSDEHQLHALLMTEGDQLAGETDAPIEWFEDLTREGRALYIEPGLWIAAEHANEYAAAFTGIFGYGGEGATEIAGGSPENARRHIVRRALRYHGGHSRSQITDRYGWPDTITGDVLAELIAGGEIINDGDEYYHFEVYEYARRRTISARRAIIQTQPPERYAALLAGRVGRETGTPVERVLSVLRAMCGQAHPAAAWESVLLPGRVAGYRPELLDSALTRGEVFWQISDNMSLTFYLQDDMSWDDDTDMMLAEQPQFELDVDEQIIIDALMKRGALFTQGLTAALGGRSPYDALLSLVGKGLVRADSFIPVRQFLDKDKLSGASIRQRARARSQMLTSGRWELSKRVAQLDAKERINRIFDNVLLLCRETASGFPWVQALEILRVWEYTGQVRRGYFVEGLSGAQFVREEDFAYVTAALARTDKQIVWLPAQDSAQPWGKSLQHLPGCAFMNIAGTVVCLWGGVPIIVFERQGQTLRFLREPPGAGDGGGLGEIISNSGSGSRTEPGEEVIIEALKLFAELFTRRRIYSSRSSLTIKQYPPEATDALVSAGFTRYIQDYVLYRK